MVKTDEDPNITVPEEQATEKPMPAAYVEFSKKLKLEVIRRLKTGDIEIPLLPNIATKVLRLSSDPNTAINDFSEVIRQDQYLTAQIVRIANSPVFGGLYEVTNLERAMVQIGIRTIKDLILGLSMGATVFRNKEYQAVMDDLWKHSMAVAYISQKLASRYATDPEYAFLCGLVHDIGKPFLMDVVAKIVKSDKQKGTLPMEIINDILDQLHPAVGGILAKRWKFGEAAMFSVTHHHNYQEIPSFINRKMANLIQASNLIAHFIGIGLAHHQVDPENEPTFVDLGMTPEDIAQFLEVLPGQIEAYIISVTIS